jgi:Type I phosphodiesterase / nucleotide pyrophosphatase
MRYLRMLTNSVVGGLIVAAYLTVLVLHLNPALGLDPKGAVPLFVTMALFYGVHAAALFYVLIVVWQVLAVEVLSPGWLSVRLLGWILAGASTLGAALMWTNLVGFEAALDPPGAQRMTAAAIALTACAVVLGAFACFRYSVGRRNRGLSAVLLGVVALASFVLPLVARRPAPDERPTVRATSGTIGELTLNEVPRISMILLDGASLEFIAPVAAQGRLPHFGRLLDEGAVLHLATLRPTQPAPVWTSVATGKLPFRHGIRSAATYAFRGGDRTIALLPDYCYAQALVRFGFLREEPHTSAAVLATPFWEILGSFGISTGVVGWPLTFPARAVHGYLVSDEFTRTAAPSSRIALAGDPAIMYPDDLLPVVQRAYDAVTPALASSALAGASVPWPASEGENGGGANPLLVDRASEHVAAALQNDQSAQVTAVRYPGLDAMGHQYLRYAMPRTFGDVSDEDRRRYGRVLEQYYSYLDAMIGRAAATLGPNDLLLIVSGFGMEPLSPGKRLFERFVGNASLSGTHERAPDGFLIAYGGPVQRGRLNRGSVLDVVPTVLYFLGLPVARDMDGHARTDLFPQSFTSERPITFIPSYDR